MEPVITPWGFTPVVTAMGVVNTARHGVFFDILSGAYLMQCACHNLKKFTPS